MSSLGDGDENEPRVPRPTFPTPRHTRVHDLLKRLVSEGCARFFADACDLLQQQPPPRTATHLISHLMREVEGMTEDVLLNLPKAKARLEATPPGEKGHSHATKIRAILYALDLESEAIAKAWLLSARDESWHATTHRRGLRLPRMLTEDFKKRVDRFVDILQGILNAAERSYADLLRGMDSAISKETPGPAEAKAVADLLAPGVTALAHVFEKLSPNWLVPLRKEGAFAEPPDVHQHEDGGISFPPWPQGAYLARLAKQLPADVAETIVSVPQVDNESVHIAFLDAACEMPVEHAARVARHELPWLSSHRWTSGYLPVCVSSLAIRLLDGGDAATATELIRSSLALIPQTGSDEDGLPRFNAWAYGEFVRKVFPAMAKHDPAAASKVLTDILGVEQSPRSAARHRLLRRIMRSELSEPRESLFGQLRAVCMMRASTGDTGLRAVLADLDALKHPLYDDLAIEVLTEHGAAAPELVQQRALSVLGANDRESEVDGLIALLRRQLVNLTPEQTQSVIAAVRDWASESRIRARIPNKSLEDDKVGWLSRRELFKFLRGLREARPAETEAEFAAFLAEFGDEEEVQSGIRGPASPPRTAQELAALDDVGLVKFLRDWKDDPEEPFESSTDALSRELKSAVVADVARFSRVARSFVGLPSTYVASVCWGLHEGIQTKVGDEPEKDEPKKDEPEKDELEKERPAKIQWDSLDTASVLDLIEWTIAQPAHPERHDTRTTSSYEDDETDWTWAHRMALDIAEDIAFRSKKNPAVLNRAWAVIRALIPHPDPTPKRDRDRSDDVLSFAINTVRGQALQAAIRLAYRLGKMETAEAKAMVPEVMALVSSRTDATAEPSFAIRAMLAVEFNTLFVADANVAVDLATKIFATNDTDWAARHENWQTFLRWNRQSAGVFNALKPVYELAVEHVAEEPPDIAGKLGGHLVWLAFHGAFPLDAGDNLLKQFVERAPLEARREALDDFGRAIYNTKDRLTEDILSKLRALWEWWIELATARGDARELAAFGWWFSSKHFDPAWSLPMLARVLELTNGDIGWDDAVLERLEGLSATHPGLVATCLGKLLDGPDEWLVIRSRDEVKAILRALAQTPSAPEARAIASRLVARRWLEFRELT